MHKKILIISMVTALLTACGAGKSSSNNNNHITPDVKKISYLAKPDGQYGVGFQDFHFQDNNRCPDKFYIPNVNEGDFSPENIGHCREIMVRVYYPTNQAILLGSNYYLPLIEHYKSAIQGDPNITKEQLAEFDNLKSYSYENANIISNKNISVILFSHGGGSPVQDYEIQLTNLASHGYIVIGVNSFFVGDHIALPNGHIVHQQQNIPDEVVINEMKSNLLYIRNNLDQIRKVLPNMDINNVGIFGHSYGGAAVSSLVREQPGDFKAAAALEASIGIGEHGDTEVVYGFDIPFLHELSGSRYYSAKLMNISTLTYNLSNNNYIIGLAPNDEILHKLELPLYTVHAEFSDDSGFKSMPAIQQAVIDAGQTNMFGTASSAYIATSINTGLINFFDFYLKDGGKGDNPFANCKPLSDNTIIKCGPTVY